ncbi:MAG: metal ABC transporter permease [Nitrosomonadales bacterium]|nr:metal ABC transporter permease [Nitrosomonadales bacterium]
MTLADLSLLSTALIAGLLVLATHIPLGIKVLQRGVIFADLAVAQMAGLGVIGAGLAGWEESPLAIQLCAVASALIGAALLAALERWPLAAREAGIGLIFVLAATGGILLMSRDTHAGEHLKDLLVGQILWVSDSQLLAVAALTALLLLVWRSYAARLGDLGFYAMFALAVTASVQLVGVYLVFASLIVPALATRHIKHRIWPAVLIGVTGYLAGLLLSVWADLPAGATIVWTMALAGGLWAWLGALIRQRE